jgi:MFS family permease
VLPIYGKRLGASALEIGGLFSIFSIMTVLLRPVVGWALDRFGRKVFFTAGLLGYAGTMTLFAVAGSLIGLYLARLVQGIASSLLWISAYTIATDIASSEQRGKAVGHVDEASAQGALYGAFVGFAVLSALPLLTGWRVLFAGYALLAAVGAWRAWRNVPETRLSQPDRSNGKLGFSALLFRLMVIVFITSLSTAMIGPLLLIFLQDRFTTSVSTLALAYIPAALVYSFLPSRMGRLSDRLGRVPLMAIGLAASGLASLILPGLPNIGWLIVLWVAEAIGLTAAAPAQEALVADLTGNDVRGTGYGLYTFAASLGATFGPLLGGWLYDAAGHAMPFYLNGTVLLAGTVAIWILLHGKIYQSVNRQVESA